MKKNCNHGFLFKKLILHNIWKLHERSNVNLTINIKCTTAWTPFSNAAPLIHWTHHFSRWAPLGNQQRGKKSRRAICALVFAHAAHQRSPSTPPRSPKPPGHSWRTTFPYPALAPRPSRPELNVTVARLHFKYARSFVLSPPARSSSPGAPPLTNRRHRLAR